MGFLIFSNSATEKIVGEGAVVKSAKADFVPW
jgi:hypothetical protein